ncbi:hypothetical protein NB520_03630 [Vibrio antiquarius]|uniref:hypothetical protein n=1 Tax=Vibrio antiquarius (strain Ex25) TaxID=150340 RepID=UPI00265AD543|nr:hypothetical protein [Vibrio antiquarius]MCR9626933.1 hypothetical protein [Vibrio antiquarius]MCR9630582.1 hypothetical protein [Vibrio antiquarius]
MNKEMQIFDYDGMKVETILQENDKGKTVPYFHGSSVAIILGYEEPNKSIKRHCNKTIKMSKLDIQKLVSYESSDITPYKSLTDSGYSHGEIIAKQSKLDIEKAKMALTKTGIPVLTKTTT